MRYDDNIFYSMCFFPLNLSIIILFFSLLWYVSNLTWNLVSKLSSLDGFPEIRVITSFSVSSVENLFGVSFRYYLNCLSFFFVNNGNYSKWSFWGGVKQFVSNNFWLKLFCLLFWNFGIPLDAKWHNYEINQFFVLSFSYFV